MATSPDSADPNPAASPATSSPQEAGDTWERSETALPPRETPRSLSLSHLSRSVRPLPAQISVAGSILVATGVMLAALLLDLPAIAGLAALVVLGLSLRIIWLAMRPMLRDLVSEQQWHLTVSVVATVLATWALLKTLGGDRWLLEKISQANWDAVGALGEVFGALGQILIAVLALYVAWRQYVIEKDLTTQQNIITQQQTIDSYFQGISDLVLDDEGLLEDWPQERAIAEARTAAILSSVDAGGKAKIIRFLSRANLLTPLKRDQRLGRAILDGSGGYAEDRAIGIRVIDLGVMLAGANLSGSDLRWTDLSEINLIRVNLSRCDLVKANLARTILVDANLRSADLKGTRLFYGRAEDATPRSQTEAPNYQTGEHTGAVVAGADFTDVTQLSAEQRYYCCAWGGSRTRSTIPGGCDGIPNKLA